MIREVSLKEAQIFPQALKSFLRDQERETVSNAKVDEYSFGGAEEQIYLYVRHLIRVNK